MQEQSPSHCKAMSAMEWASTADIDRTRHPTLDIYEVIGFPKISPKIEDYYFGKLSIYGNLLNLEIFSIGKPTIFGNFPFMETFHLWKLPKFGNFLT